MGWEATNLPSRTLVHWMLHFTDLSIILRNTTVRFDTCNTIYLFKIYSATAQFPLHFRYVSINVQILQLWYVQKQCQRVSSRNWFWVVKGRKNEQTLYVIVSLTNQLLFTRILTYSSSCFLVMQIWHLFQTITHTFWSVAGTSTADPLLSTPTAMIQTVTLRFLSMYVNKYNVVICISHCVKLNKLPVC
jgi:hypothetical protein